jgi:hypothetical protein
MPGCICHERWWIADRGTICRLLTPISDRVWCLTRSLIHGTKMSLTAFRRQMLQHHFGPSNSQDTSLPPVTSLTRHWSLQGDCREVGSIDTSSLHQCKSFPFSLDSDVRSLFKRALVMPPKTPDLTRIGLPHHIDCLLNRARRDGPWSKHPCQLLQLLALDRLVSFSSTSTRYSGPQL